MGVRRLVALESVAQVMFVVHVTLGAQVIVKAHLAFPAHPHDAVLFTAVTDDVGMAHTWRRESGGERKPRLLTVKFSAVFDHNCLNLKKLLIEG